jgi:REP element-mobilizing transposase RayT
MPNYRRNRIPGATYFFTVNLRDRRSGLLVAQIDALREAVRAVRRQSPFHIDAWVVLPDHMHLPVDPSRGRQRLPRPLAKNQNRVLEIVARSRWGIANQTSQRRTRHLAARLLGTHDPR